MAPALEGICLKAMAKSPADRYTTAADMADDLQRFLSGQGHAISEEFRILHECMGGLLAWGGQLQASSEVGRGFHFELTLPTVI